MHYVSNVLGIRDPIHKQKIALKAMDVVLFGPPRGKPLLKNFGRRPQFSHISIDFIPQKLEHAGRITYSWYCC